MNIKQAALIAAVGLFLSFTVRTLGTVIPEVFVSGPVALVGILVQLIGGLALFWFLIVFLHGLGADSTRVLQRTTVVAIAGSLMALVPELQGLVKLLGVAPFSPWVNSESLQVAASWFEVAALTAFFAVLLHVARDLADDWLGRGAKAGLVGSVALLIMASLTAVGFFVGPFVHGPNILPLLFAVAIPLVVTGFVATMFFFITVYQHPPWMSGGHLESRA